MRVVVLVAERDAEEEEVERESALFRLLSLILLHPGPRRRPRRRQLSTGCPRLYLPVAADLVLPLLPRQSSLQQKQQQQREKGELLIRGAPRGRRGRRQHRLEPLQR